jgi:outer membrane protein assembly factor BamB
VWGFVGSLPPPKGFVWSFRRPGEEGFVGTPAVGAGMVYIASGSGAVFGLDRSDGHLVWTFRADAKITGSLSIAGQTLYVGDAEGVLYGIDILTGEAEWRFQADDRISSTAVVANGMLYVASASGTLYAIQ